MGLYMHIIYIHIYDKHGDSWCLLGCALRQQDSAGLPRRQFGKGQDTRTGTSVLHMTAKPAIMRHGLGTDKH